MKMKQSSPKRRYIKFRRRGITQKKAYDNYNSCYTNSLMTGLKRPRPIHGCRANNDDDNDMIWYIFNRNWVATLWQLFSTHVHTNNAGNVTTQTMQRAQKYIEQHKKIHSATQQLGRVRAVPRLCGIYPGICLTTEEKARKNLSQGRKNLSQGREISVRVEKPQSW